VGDDGKVSAVCQAALSEMRTGLYSEVERRGGKQRQHGVSPLPKAVTLPTESTARQVFSVEWYRPLERSKLFTVLIRAFSFVILLIWHRDRRG
jgi:hypothetical protein